MKPLYYKKFASSLLKHMSYMLEKENPLSELTSRMELWEQLDPGIMETDCHKCVKASFFTSCTIITCELTRNQCKGVHCMWRQTSQVFVGCFHFVSRNFEASYTRNELFISEPKYTHTSLKHPSYTALPLMGCKSVCPLSLDTQRWYMD